MARGLLEGYQGAETQVSNLATAALARRDAQLKIEKQELENRSRKLFIEMSGGSAEDVKAATEPLSTRAARLANIAITAGDLDYAGKLSTVAARGAIMDKNAQDLRLRQMDYADRRLAGVDNQASWTEVVTELDGADSQLLRVPYSPNAVERLRKGLVPATDKALIDSRKSTIQTNEVRKELIKAQTALAAVRKENVKKRTDLLGKSGGKATKDPSRAAVDAAQVLVEKAYPKHPDAFEAATTLASRAQELRQQNIALGLMDSVRQAFRESVEAGDFAESPAKTLFGMKLPGTGKPRFVGEGKTAESAIAIPGTAGELTKGRYYHNDKGAVAIWTGKSMRLVGQKMTPDERLEMQLGEETDNDTLDELEEEDEVVE